MVQKIRGNAGLKSVLRHGEDPEMLSFATTEEELCAIADLIPTDRASAHTSLSIICNTKAQAQEIITKLKPYGNDIHFLSRQHSIFE